MIPVVWQWMFLTGLMLMVSKDIWGVLEVYTGSKPEYVNVTAAPKYSLGLIFPMLRLVSLYVPSPFVFRWFILCDALCPSTLMPKIPPKSLNFAAVSFVNRVPFVTNIGRTTIYISSFLAWQYFISSWSKAPVEVVIIPRWINFVLSRIWIL